MPGTEWPFLCSRSCRLLTHLWETERKEAKIKQHLQTLNSPLLIRLVHMKSLNHRDIFFFLAFSLIFSFFLFPSEIWDTPIDCWHNNVQSTLRCLSLWHQDCKEPFGTWQESRRLHITHAWGFAASSYLYRDSVCPNYCFAFGLRRVVWKRYRKDFQRSVSFGFQKW